MVDFMKSPKKVWDFTGRVIFYEKKIIKNCHFKFMRNKLIIHKVLFGLQWSRDIFNLHICTHLVDVIDVLLERTNFLGMHLKAALNTTEYPLNCSLQGTSFLSYYGL